MNYLDIILVMPLVWGAIIGFKKGLIIEVTTLIGIGLGIYGAIKGAGFMAEWLSHYVEWSKRLMRIAGFIITFLLIVIVIQLLGRALEKLIKLAALGLINRITGSIFGIIKYTLLTALLVYFSERIDKRYPFIPDALRTGSLIYTPFAGLIPEIYPGIEGFVAPEVGQD